MAKGDEGSTQQTVYRDALGRLPAILAAIFENEVDISLHECQVVLHNCLVFLLRLWH